MQAGIDEEHIAVVYDGVPIPAEPAHGDAILAPMYSGRDLAAAEQRLRDFLVVRFGGPSRYLEQRGHPRLRMRHMPFTIDQKARDRWIQLMSAAFEEAKLPADAEGVLRAFFESTATFLINKAEP